jgi:hypothetical protein
MAKPRVTKCDGNPERWAIDVEEDVRILWWRGEGDLCHVVVKRERQKLEQAA